MKYDRINGAMRIKLGTIQATLYGGPFAFHEPDRRLVSVKMAAEVDRACDISIPTEDYNVPDRSDMAAGLTQAIKAMADGNDLYIGCMGGIGRTGLFMALMTKVMLRYDGNTESDVAVMKRAVDYVRQNYIRKAVETESQKAYIASFDVEPFVKLAIDLQIGRVVERVKEVPKLVLRDRVHVVSPPTEYVYYGFWAWVKDVWENWTK